MKRAADEGGNAAKRRRVSRTRADFVAARGGAHAFAQRLQLFLGPDHDPHTLTVKSIIPRWTAGPNRTVIWEGEDDYDLTLPLDTCYVKASSVEHGVYMGHHVTVEPHLGVLDRYNVNTALTWFITCLW